MIDAASLPAPGSVSANAATFSPVASFGRYFFFWASVPKRRSALSPIDWCAPMVTASDESIDASSCTTRA